MNRTFKMMSVNIYRHGNYDCTNNGVSSRHDNMTCFAGSLEDIKGYVEKEGMDIDKCLYVERREIWGEPSPILVPLAWKFEKPKGIAMFGGNYANGDSRWREWFGHYLPLPIHDRCETQEQYNGLCK